MEKQQKSPKPKKITMPQLMELVKKELFRLNPKVKFYVQVQKWCNHSLKNEDLPAYFFLGIYEELIDDEPFEHYLTFTEYFNNTHTSIDSFLFAIKFAVNACLEKSENFELVLT